MAEENKYKTVLMLPFGHHEWSVISFGLTNASSKFQNIMKTYFVHIHPLQSFTLIMSLYFLTLLIKIENIYMFPIVVKNASVLVPIEKENCSKQRSNY